MMNIEKYYEIEWYDNSYTDYYSSGCWKFNNRFKTLEEARKFIDEKRCPSGVDLRIVCKTEKVIETIINKNN